MDRAARAKKPSKAASALESLRAIKAGEAKAIDNLELEDEDAVYEEDDAAGREYEEATPEDQCPKKRKHETDEDKATRKRAAGNLARMQRMFATAPVRQKSQTSDAAGDGLLADLLNELDEPGAAQAKPVTARPTAAPRQSHAQRAPRKRPPPTYDPLSAPQHEPEASMDMPDDLPEAPQPDDTPEPAQPEDQLNEDTAEKADVDGTDTKGPGCILPVVQDAVPEAASGWQSAVAADDGTTAADADVEMHEAEDDDDMGEAPQADTVGGDTLQFFFLDALYEPAMVGTVLLIGKVLQGNEYVSACVRAKDMKQCVYIVPKPFVFQDTEGDIERLYEEVKAGTARKGKLLKLLHDRCTELKKEVRERLGTDTVIKPVMRTYAFEDARIPTGPQWVLKVTCNAAPGSMRSDLSGRNFNAVLGTSQTPLEALQLKRKIMGPSWLSLTNAVKEEPQNQLSWCKVEYIVSGHKSVTPAAKQPPMPPIRIAAVNVKTVPDSSETAQEIVAVSVLHTMMRTDLPMDVPKWRSANSIKRFTVICPPHGTISPAGLQNHVKSENAKMNKSNGGDTISVQASERALLAYLLARWQTLDADFIIGHNIGPWDLTILLQRLQHHKVPHFSRVGRLKRQRVPNLSGGGGMYGGGASHGVLQCFSGRLLLDTYVQSRDLLKEVEYSLATLAGKLLGQQRMELNPHQVRQMFEDAANSMKLVRHAESDAWLAMGLAIYLNAVPLTLQLSNISGFLWSRTLQGNRAQRIEMLLLHEFHARKFLLPDKPKKDNSKTPGPAAKASTAAKEEDGEEPRDGEKASKTPAKSKGPQYAGGLVLEPKKGIYNKFVLLLDFNSLYPSIIQEYNICFTTVKRPDDDNIPDLPASGRNLAPLPVVIQGLVQKRRAVKASMKNCSDPVKKQQLDIRQTAIKLTANSMYGCLGFTASRFYAKPLAQLITCQGREILQRTVDLVQGTLNLEVIYGDTDSIMIATNSTDMEKVFQLGEEAKRAINKHYRLLEIDIDGVFKSMLLLKKKKYAAVKIVPAPGGGSAEMLESKGIDIVRRDWCLLSREIGKKCLQEILSGREQEDIVEVVHELLRTVGEQVNAGAVHSTKFVITKQLTKQPEDYPDAKTQAHVQVALRMKARGKRDGTRAGNAVQYIICTDKQAEPGASMGLAGRAYHPSELQENSNLAVDSHYYLSHQLHPVVARICAPLEMTSDARLAECLGLDPSKFKKSMPVSEKLASIDNMTGTATVLDDDERFCDLQPLALVDDKGTAVALPDLSSGASWESCMGSAEAGLSRMDAAHLSNQAVLATRSVMKQYYTGNLRTEESGTGFMRDITLAPEHPTLGACAPGTCPLAPGAMSIMEPAIPEAQAYLQLTHVSRQLDVARVQARVPDDASAKQQLAKLLQVVGAAVSTVNRLAHTASYHWVNLSSFSGMFQSLEVS